MFPKTSRWISDSVSKWKAEAAAHEPTVTTAMRMPRTRAAWCGLKRPSRGGAVSLIAGPNVLGGVTADEPGGPLVRDGVDLGVGVAEPSRHGGEQLVRQPRHLVDHAGELTLADDQQLHVGLGDDAG